MAVEGATQFKLCGLDVRGTFRIPTSTWRAFLQQISLTTSSSVPRAGLGGYLEQLTLSDVDCGELVGCLPSTLRFLGLLSCASANPAVVPTLLPERCPALEVLLLGGTLVQAGPPAAQQLGSTLAAMAQKMPRLRLLEVTFLGCTDELRLALGCRAKMLSEPSSDSLDPTPSPLAVWDLAGHGACHEVVTAVTSTTHDATWRRTLELAARAAATCRESRSLLTPLHYAVAATPEEAALREVRAVLSLGVRPERGDVSRSTPLFRACESGKTSVASALMAAGADPLNVNLSGEAPLYIAALRGHTGCVAVLLNGLCGGMGSAKSAVAMTWGLLKSSSSTRDWTHASAYGDGWTPLHAATLSSREDVVELLLQEALREKRNSGNTKGGRAARGPRLVNEVNRTGQTALHLAARKGSLQLLRHLLKAGARDVKDRRGHTAHQVALAHEQEAAAQLLASHTMGPIKEQRKTARRQHQKQVKRQAHPAQV
eukprot:gene6158-7385_t